MAPQQNRMKTFHPMGPSGVFEPLAIAVAKEIDGGNIIDTQSFGNSGAARRRLPEREQARGFLMDFAAA